MTVRITSSEAFARCDVRNVHFFARSGLFNIAGGGGRAVTHAARARAMLRTHTMLYKLAMLRFIIDVHIVLFIVP